MTKAVPNMIYILYVHTSGYTSLSSFLSVCLSVKEMKQESLQVFVWWVGEYRATIPIIMSHTIFVKSKQLTFLIYWEKKGRQPFCQLIPDQSRKIRNLFFFTRENSVDIFCFCFVFSADFYGRLEYRLAGICCCLYVCVWQLLRETKKGNFLSVRDRVDGLPRVQTTAQPSPAALDSHAHLIRNSTVPRIMYTMYT